MMDNSTESSISSLKSLTLESECSSFEVLQRFQTDTENAELIDSNSTITDSVNLFKETDTTELMNNKESDIPLINNSLTEALHNLTSSFAHDKLDGSHLKEEDFDEDEKSLDNSGLSASSLNESDLVDPEALLVGDCIKVSKKCLQYCKEEQSALKEMLLSVNEMKSGIGSLVESQTDRLLSSSLNQESEQFATPSKLNSKTKETKKQETEELPLEMPTYLQIFENRLSEMYPKIIFAVLIGFCVSFILFLAYTVVFENYKMQQIQTFENMTKEERQQKEKYRTETDNFREILMHKSYEEARASTDVLKECENSKQNLKTQITSLENSVFRLNLESREAEKESQGKIDALRQVVDNLKTENKKLKGEILKSRNSRSWYDYSVLAGLLVGLLCVIFLASTKH